MQPAEAAAAAAATMAAVAAEAHGLPAAAVLPTQIRC